MQDDDPLARNDLKVGGNARRSKIPICLVRHLVTAVELLSITDHPVVHKAPQCLTAECRLGKFLDEVDAAATFNVDLGVMDRVPWFEIQFLQDYLPKTLPSYKASGSKASSS